MEDPAKQPATFRKPISIILLVDGDSYVLTKVLIFDLRHYAV